MAPPPFRSAAVSGAASTSVVVSKPSGVVEDDGLVAIIACSNGVSLPTVTPPSGWALVSETHRHATTTDVCTYVYTKAAGGSEPASYTFTSTTNASGAIAAYIGAGATPNAVAAADGDGTSLPAPTVTTTVNDCVVVRLYGHQNATLTEAAGTTERVEAAAFTAPMVMVADAAQPSGGSTGAKTATADIGGRWGAHTVALPVANVAPNAPTLVSPVGGVSIDLAAIQRLSWTFSDPDPGDSQSKFDLRYRPAAGGTWTDITQTTPNNFYDLPAATLTAGDYEWQVRTYDALGLVGPYSSSAFFTAAAVSNDITITAPTNGATIPTETFTVTWSTPTQTHYQLRVVADLAGAPDPATVIYDTGEIASSSARSRQVSYPDNGVTRHTQVRKKQDGLWSDWASVSNLVSYTAPAVPSIIVDDTSLAGAIQVQATHPTPTGSEPTVSYMDVWRRRAKVDANGNFVEWYDTERDPGGENGFPHRDGSQLAPTAIFTDWFVNGSGYSYRVRDVGSNGTSSYSEWSDDGSGEVVNEIDGGAPDTVYDDELDGGGP